MIPITQTVLTAPGGDCFPACLASILEMNLADVPNFQGSDWQRRYHDWLQPLGLAMITAGLPHEDDLRNWPEIVLPGYTILAIDSPRFPGFFHAVVALDGQVVWDPHPAAKAEDFLGFIWREVTYLVALNAGTFYRTTLKQKGGEELSF